jgi:methyltransferase (TIGR00027 family)
VREKRPSQTASFVALARSLADRGFTRLPAFSDPVVASLLSPGWTVTLEALTRWMRRADRSRRDRAIAQLDVIPMRVAVIDAEVEKAVAAGCRQLVILGAGLDTRAFRMASLADVDVYEVDHPATQAYKKRKTSALRRAARSIAFVPVDFERNALRRALIAAGHRDREPTAWLWEGVVMYLSDEALRTTLGDVGASSTPGSALLVHYHEPVRRGRPQLARRLLLALWREPHIGPRTAERMEAEVRRAGFDVESDTGPTDWAGAMGILAPEGETAMVTRLLVARR